MLAHVLFSTVCPFVHHVCPFVYHRFPSLYKEREAPPVTLNRPSMEAAFSSPVITSSKPASDFLVQAAKSGSQSELVPPSPRSPMVEEVIVGNGLASLDCLMGDLDVSSVNLDQSAVLADMSQLYVGADDKDNVSEISMELRFQGDSPVYVNQGDEGGLPGVDELLNGGTAEDRAPPPLSPPPLTQSSPPHTAAPLPPPPSTPPRPPSPPAPIPSLPSSTVAFSPPISQSISASQTFKSTLKDSSSLAGANTSKKQFVSKSVLVKQLDSLLEHKHRTLFEKAVKDKQAPNYSRFLDATTHLYKRSCPSVRRS